MCVTNKLNAPFISFFLSSEKSEITFRTISYKEKRAKPKRIDISGFKDDLIENY